VLSAPKAASVTALTLDPQLIQDITLVLVAAAAFGALFEVRAGARGSWRRPGSRLGRVPLEVPGDD
jgi:hypothetical protein